MTPDDFTEAARAKAEKRWPSYPSVGFSGADDRQCAFREGAEWARAHLAAQESTDTTALQERIETALLRATDNGADRTEEYAAAVLPIIAAEVQAAKAAAWDEGYIAPIEAAAHNPYRRETGGRA